MMQEKHIHSHEAPCHSSELQGVFLMAGVLYRRMDILFNIYVCTKKDRKRKKRFFR